MSSGKTTKSKPVKAPQLQRSVTEVHLAEERTKMAEALAKINEMQKALEAAKRDAEELKRKAEAAAAERAKRKAEEAAAAAAAELEKKRKADEEAARCSKCGCTCKRLKAAVDDGKQETNEPNDDEDDDAPQILKRTTKKADRLKSDDEEEEHKPKRITTQCDIIYPTPSAQAHWERMACLTVQLAKEKHRKDCGVRVGKNNKYLNRTFTLSVQLAAAEMRKWREEKPEAFEKHLNECETCNAAMKYTTARVQKVWNEECRQCQDKNTQAVAKEKKKRGMKG